MSLPELPGVLAASDIADTVATIAQAQERCGAIAWFPGGQTDPWDHVEAAMALDVGGLHAQAAAAYEWLRRIQAPDGSWAARYQSGVVLDPTAESNHAGYFAVGCWHHWLCTGETEFLTRMWPALRRALDFVLRLQAPNGWVWWAADDAGRVDQVALLTGCSSVHHGLRCGLAIAEQLGFAQPDWELALGQLRHALLHHPTSFADKSRYSMDWYYPILGGALRGADAAERLADGWDRFVATELGVRCVADQPWVTGAETCELALTLDTIGHHDRAAELVAAMQHLRHPDGSYWTGLVYDDGQRWPVERTSWTAAAVVLAVDALHAEHRRAAIFRADELPLGADLGAACGVDLMCEEPG